MSEFKIRDWKVAKLLKRLRYLSDKYHKLSCLFYEFANSIECRYRKGEKYKELAKTVKNLDLDNIIELSRLTLKKKEKYKDE